MEIGIRQATKQGYIKMNVGGYAIYHIQQANLGAAEYKETAMFPLQLQQQVVYAKF